MDEIDWKKVGFLLAFVLLIIISVYFFYQYQKTQELLKITQLSNEGQTFQIKQQVAKLIELPDETPTIATVLDINKLKDQPFFRRAKNGDKVLVFKEAKKAILFRPSINKIIEVSPITTEATASAGIISPTPSSSPEKNAALPTLIATPTFLPSPTR